MARLAAGADQRRLLLRSVRRTSVGETIECALAFKAAGASFNAQREATLQMGSREQERLCRQRTRAKRRRKALSAGAVAKLALGVEAQGGNPENVEGRNLIADLKCLQVASGPEAGRFSDKNQTDFSNVTRSVAGDHRAEGVRSSNCTGKPNLTSLDRSGRRLPARPAVRGKQTEDVERRVPLDDGPRGQHLQRRAAVSKTKAKTKTRSKSTPPAPPSRRCWRTGRANRKRRRPPALKWLKKQRKGSSYWENYCSFERILDRSSRASTARRSRSWPTSREVLRCGKARSGWKASSKRSPRVNPACRRAPKAVRPKCWRPRRASSACTATSYPKPGGAAIGESCGGALARRDDAGCQRLNRAIARFAAALTRTAAAPAACWRSPRRERARRRRRRTRPTRTRR